MTAGNPFLRSVKVILDAHEDESANKPCRSFNSSDFAQRAITHMCMTEEGGSNETNHLPRQPCSKLRSQVFLPSCWDGKNLDSPDHKSHVSGA